MNIVKYNWTEEIDNRITELALEAIKNHKPFITAFRIVSDETGIPTPNVSNRWNLKLKKNFESNIIEYKKKKAQARTEKKHELLKLKRSQSDLSLESMEMIKLLQQDVFQLRREMAKVSKENESLKNELIQLRQLDHIAGLMRVMKKL